MKLSEFKKQAEKIGVGNRCITKIDNTEITDAQLQKEDGYWFVCQNERDGVDCDDKLGYTYSWEIVDDSDAEDISYLKPYKKTLETCEKGDSLVDKDGGEYMVIERLGDLVFPSQKDAFDAVSASTYHWKELQKCGYTVKGQPEEEMVDVDGKEISLSTVKKALQSYIS